MITWKACTRAPCLGWRIRRTGSSWRVTNRAMTSSACGTWSTARKPPSSRSPTKKRQASQRRKPRASRLVDAGSTWQRAAPFPSEAPQADSIMRVWESLATGKVVAPSLPCRQRCPMRLCLRLVSLQVLLVPAQRATLLLRECSRRKRKRRAEDLQPQPGSQKSGSVACCVLSGPEVLRDEWPLASHRMGCEDDETAAPSRSPYGAGRSTRPTVKLSPDKARR